MIFLADGYQKLAYSCGENLEAALQAEPNASYEERAYLEGYCEGHRKAYLDMAEDFRKVLRDNPPSRFHWPHISLGFNWRF
jgi:hypothetical protein